MKALNTIYLCILAGVMLLSGSAGLAEETRPAGCDREKSTMKITLPYRAEAAFCYERLKETRPVFRDGLEEMKACAGTGAAFDERLSRMVRAHLKTIEDARKEPSGTSWNEEDVFVCCAFDLIAFAFAGEVEAIAADTSAAGRAKKAGLDRLVELLNGIPFSGPTWNHSAKPAIRKNIDDHLRQLP